MRNDFSIRDVSRLHGVCLALALGALACGDDAAKDKNVDCPDGGVCADSTGGSMLDGSTAGSGGANAGNGSSNAGTGAAGNGTAGTGTAGNGTAGTTAPAVGKPATDGTQFAACDPDDDASCGNDLACYTADGATPVGYCTKTCTMDTDCTALGASFSCSSATQAVPTQYCRSTCAGADDDSCPAMMSCLQVTGGFRCLYDTKDLGSGTAAAWHKCEISGDCTGELVCYPEGAATQGGATYAGACTGTCTMDEDCTNVPTTGNVTPTCGGGSNCVLNCGAANPGGAPAPDAGTLVCPDGMECASLGAGRMRCMYIDTTGGI